MRILTGPLIVCGLLAAAPIAASQPPEDFREGPPESADAFASRMIARFDKDHDGKLTRAELTEPRLHRLFDQADADKDGTVTTQELTALATRELANDRGGPPGFGPPGGGPPGFGPPGFGPPGGPMMGPPRPGEVLPAMVRRRLRLTDEQQAQLDALQKDVDERLAKILTDEQKHLLRRLREGPGRPGGPPPGGRGGFPPDGPPPGGPPQGP